MGPMGGVERVQGLGFNRFGFRVLGVLPPNAGVHTLNHEPQNER